MHHSRNGGNLEEDISFMCCNRNNNADDLSKGLQIEEPDIFVPWTLCESDVENYFEKHQLNKVTSGYYVMKNVRLFDTLTCNLGLHFRNSLWQFELFQDDYGDLRVTFHERQSLQCEV